MTLAGISRPMSFYVSEMQMARDGLLKIVGDVFHAV